MASLNQCNFIGNLGADPEVKSFQNGGRIANLRLATSESWKDKQTGERQERTEWHSVAVLSDGLVGVVERYLRKGSKIYVEGQLRTRKWQDSAGQDRYTTEVALGPRGVLVMLDGANKSNPAHPEEDRRDVSKGPPAGDPGPNPSSDHPEEPRSGVSMGDELDDDIPF